jgi:plastocyanin
VPQPPVGGLTLSVLLVTACCAAGAAFAPAAPQLGRLQGRVTITVPVSKAPPSAAYGARRVERAGTDSASELTNVVVFLQDAPKPPTLQPSRARIVQENETFVPRVVAITRGSTVDFPNADPFFHDVFSLSRSGTFDLGSYPRGRTKSQQFRRAGLIKVYCHIHSHMSASIMVLDHPYFTVPRLDGTFTLANVPPGRYTLIGWHERVGERAGSIVVEAGRTAAIDLSLPVEDDR